MVTSWTVFLGELCLSVPNQEAWMCQLLFGATRPQLFSSGSNVVLLYPVSWTWQTKTDCRILTTRKGTPSLLWGSKGERKREKEECPVLQIVVAVSQIGWSQVSREMAPESYELLIPGLSDSWLSGLWARDAAIWASDTWMDKRIKIWDEALTGNFTALLKVTLPSVSVNARICV